MMSGWLLHLERVHSIHIIPYFPCMSRDMGTILSILTLGQINPDIYIKDKQITEAPALLGKGSAGDSIKGWPCERPFCPCES